LIRVMAMPEVRDRLAAGGVSVVTSKSPQDFHEFMKRDSARWANIVKVTGITVD